MSETPTTASLSRASSTSSAFPPVSSETRPSTTDFASPTTTTGSASPPLLSAGVRRSTPPPQADDSPAPLHDSLSELEERLRRFDARLSAASAAEAEFRASVQSWTNSLDTFIYRHIDDNEHLARLIDDDTQRSQEVKEGYEALASMLVPHVRGPSPTRVRNLLATVWAYIGIVLSLVLFGPVHALWTFVSRRFGPPQQPIQSARRRPRSKEERRAARAAGAQQGSDQARGRASGTTAATTAVQESTPGRASTTVSTSATTKTGNSVTTTSPAGPSRLGESAAIVSSLSAATEKATSASNASENGSEEEFVDALDQSRRYDDTTADGGQDGNHTGSADTYGRVGRVTTPAAVMSGGRLEEVTEQFGLTGPRRSGVNVVLSDDDEGEGGAAVIGDDDRDSETASSFGTGEGADEDGGGNEGAVRRPGWAVPSETSDDEEATKEVDFPPADFFNISEDDMPLDVLRDKSQSAE